jgi:hypothetical protein
LVFDVTDVEVWDLDFFYKWLCEFMKICPLEKIASNARVGGGKNI